MAAGTSRAAYARQYYLKNRDKMLERNRAYVEKNFEKVKARKAIHNRKRVYSLTEEEYQLMLAIQKGDCAICKIEMSKPCVDHSHVTKEVRGLLCDKCNRGLGYFRDNPNYLKNAAMYLEKEN